MCIINIYIYTSRIGEIVLKLVQQYATCGSDYQYRRAAIAGLCRLAEGSTKYFKKYFVHSLSFLTNALNDSSPRVQYEGIQVIKHHLSIHIYTYIVYIIY